MAYVYIGIDPSKGASNVTISGSSTGKAIEIAVDTAKLTSKAQATALLDFLEDKLETGSWPPA